MARTTPIERYRISVLVRTLMLVKLLPLNVSYSTPV